MSKIGDDFWNDLLTGIEDGQVIPVVGRGLVTTNQEGKNLTRWLALELATSLCIPPEVIRHPGDLHDTICTYLLEVPRARLAKVYTRIKQLLESHPFPISSSLRDLAEIPAFNLFLTTNFDLELERALNEVRFGGDPLTKFVSFYPSAGEKDISSNAADLDTTLYYLLGRVTNVQNSYAVWDDDAISFVLSFYRSLQDQELMGNLSHALKSHDLLILGVNFTDWLSRFFLQSARPDNLPQNFEFSEYFADAKAHITDSFVYFCESARSTTDIVECDPVQFVEELRRRWEERHGPAEWKSTRSPRIQVELPPRKMPAGAGC